MKTGATPQEFVIQMSKYDSITPNQCWGPFFFLYTLPFYTHTPAYLFANAVHGLHFRLMHSINREREHHCKLYLQYWSDSFRIWHKGGCNSRTGSLGPWVPREGCLVVMVMNMTVIETTTAEVSRPMGNSRPLRLNNTMALNRPECFTANRAEWLNSYIAELRIFSWKLYGYQFGYG